MKNKISDKNEKTIISALTSIETLYNYTKKDLEKINFKKLDKDSLIYFLNNCNGKYLNISTGTFINKLPNQNYKIEQLINMCENQRNRLKEENILTILDLIGKDIDYLKDNKLIRKILKDTSTSINDNIRKKCALVSPNYYQFLFDTNIDINKIAHVKADFYNRNYSKEEKQLIKLLEEMINADLIKFDYCPITINFDSKKRLIVSEIFNEDEIEIDYISTEISNKKIVANLIYNLLLESKLTFKEKYEPFYWKNILKQNGLEKVKVIMYKKIDC